MELLIPPLLTAVQEVRWLISSGRSTKDAFRLYLESSGDSLANELRERWSLKTRSSGQPLVQKPFCSHYQAAFWELIERGSQGQPILEPLTSLEREVENAADAELALHLSTLPFKVLIPLLIFQFPAFLLLLLGPILRDLTHQLGG